MAMEDEGLAEEIPLATAQHVRAQLGSLRDLDPRAGDLSRSRKDPVQSLRRSSADQQPDASRFKRRAAGQQTKDDVASWDPCGIWTDRPRVGPDRARIPAGHARTAPW